MRTGLSPVAVTGMGLVTAAGRDLPETMAALESSRPLFPPIAPPFATDFSSPVFCCSLATPELDLDPLYSRTVGLTLYATREALRMAALPEAALASLRVGIAIGSSVGASLNFWDFYKESTAGDMPSLDDIKRYRASNPAPALARILGCKGPVQTVTNACSSGADAIGLATEWIRSGFCDIALAGGADELSPITYAGFCSLRLPSASACRPFDAKRDGLNLGEGAGMVLLESETSRKQRGVSARSFVAAYGTATDAWHITAPHPQGKGLRAAVQQAFTQAAVSWEDIAFINAHGTATQANDAAEALFFHSCCPYTPFIATKGITGHTLGAAGAIEAIITAVHLNDGRLPASHGFTVPDPAIQATPVSASCAVQGHYALSQSLAFGGNNSVLLLQKGEA